MTSEFSIWLLPEPEAHARLTRRIADIAAEHAAPAFEPHVTIQGDIALPRERIHEGAAAMARAIAPQRWKVEAVSAGDHFFRCLYLRFDTQPAFGRLQKETQALTGTAVGLSPFPHLSLLYRAPGDDLAALAQELGSALAGAELVFDRLALCRSSKDVPIADWRCLAHFPLAGH